MTFTIRRAEPSDYEAVQRVYAAPKAIWGTLQLPFPSKEVWRKRLAEPPEGMFGLVACAEGDVAGHLGLHTFPNHPRRTVGGRLCDGAAPAGRSVTAGRARRLWQMDLLFTVEQFFAVFARYDEAVWPIALLAFSPAPAAQSRGVR